MKKNTILLNLYKKLYIEYFIVSTKIYFLYFLFLIFNLFKFFIKIIEFV